MKCLSKRLKEYEESMSADYEELDSLKEKKKSLKSKRKALSVDISQIKEKNDLLFKENESLKSSIKRKLQFKNDDGKLDELKKLQEKNEQLKYHQHVFTQHQEKLRENLKKAKYSGMTR